MTARELLLSNVGLIGVTTLFVVGGIPFALSGAAPLHIAFGPGVVLIPAVSARITFQAMQALRAVDNRANTIIERAVDSIVTTDASGRIESVNKAAEDVFGYRGADLAGLSIATLLSSAYEEPEEGDLWEFLRANAIAASGAAEEVIGLRRNGERFFMELSISVADFDGDEGFVAVIRDITQKKKAELALRQARDELEARVEERTGELKTANAQLTEEVRQRKAIQEAQETTLGELKQAMQDIKTLSGMIPICASCKSVRDDTGYWNRIEQYISEHSGAMFSHGICPDCRDRLYPELSDKHDSP